jgi:hypothetical protein
MPRIRHMVCLVSLLTTTGFIALGQDPVQITISAADLAAGKSPVASCPLSVKAVNSFNPHASLKLAASGAGAANLLPA